MNGNEPLPDLLEFGGTIFGPARVNAPTPDEGTQILSVQLPERYSRPWRFSIVPDSPTQAYDKLGRPLAPGAFPPADTYSQTRRARLMFYFGATQSDPVTIDVPAAGAAYNLFAAKLAVSLYDPGPDNGVSPPTKYTVSLCEAPTAPAPLPLEAWPRFTQTLVTAMGAESTAIWVVPRRAFALRLWPNAFDLAAIETAIDPRYIVKFFDGQSDICGQVVVSPTVSRNGWSDDVTIPVPSSAITYSVKCKLNVGQTFELPRAQFYINLS